jgi:hypothetical protein
MKKARLEKPTTGDYVLSVIIPGWGFLVGIIALFKREFQRGSIMIAISGVLVILYTLIRDPSIFQ